MNALPAANFRIRVDVANPGQFFACCGLLECADRMYGNAQGAFRIINGHNFFEISTREGCLPELLQKLGGCFLSSSLTTEELSRLKALLNKQKILLTKEEKVEKEVLKSLWSAERILFQNPFNLWIDWWTNENTLGTKLKTWAAKQIVFDMLCAMQLHIRNEVWSEDSALNCLNSVSTEIMPFYFDSDIGSQSSSLDVGFSLDALKNLKIVSRPVLEILAFIGLQRSMPKGRMDQFTYKIWADPLPLILIPPVICDAIPQQKSTAYQFTLFYRSKYMKSFLPATSQP